MGARSGPRSFDPVLLGNRETDAWAAYYRRQWVRFLVAAVGMVRTGFGMSWRKTLMGAFHVLRANQLWAPHLDNDPEGARASMRRFYALVAEELDLDLDVDHAARLEVEWWRLHRAHQHTSGVGREELVSALMELYSFVYDTTPEAMRDAARLRVEAMDLSDQWVAAGRARISPVLAAERRTLIASHTALLREVGRAARPR